MLDNKLGITDSVELARQEEKLTKLKAKKLFDSGDINRIEIGTFKGLAAIHHYLFSDVYEFAGKLRTVNLAKDNFQFAPRMFLEASLAYIDRLPQKTFDDIIEKYVEMNIAHPFREGNGRATRIGLDLILKQSLNQVVDWSQVDKDDYLLAMQRSPIKTTEIKHVLSAALTPKVNDRALYMKGIDHSYYYEGYMEFNTNELDD
ncbi:protein adenylyltransferase Fic [Lacticaseibacillus paracasei]|uniref:protein adenylyltransferase Fic n=1 Tax=Lacticaseibacillus paracasei TaxID=1597 RepID=UPI0018A6A937|nr:Fic family protein [Lacticaseibacillus paracasei]MCU6429490.1 Fic family protein [Lacticaseibacillus paracasei]QOP46901.1 cell filamentation protein Fic [Lacticaseibacillus paracasei]